MSSANRRLVERSAWGAASAAIFLLGVVLPAVLSFANVAQVPVAAVAVVVLAGFAVAAAGVVADPGSRLCAIMATAHAAVGLFLLLGYLLGRATPTAGH